MSSLLGRLSGHCSSDDHDLCAWRGCACPCHRRDRAPVTKRQEAVLRVFAIEGDNVCEGALIDHLYPLIRDGRSARMVCNWMEKRGLITFGLWYDDAGYEIHLTEAGREALGVLNA